MEDFNFKRLTTEQTEKLSRLQGLKGFLDKPVFDIQTLEWQNMWEELDNDINNAIELISMRSDVPESLTWQRLVVRVSQLVSQARYDED